MTSKTFFAQHTNTLVRAWRATGGAGSPLVCVWTEQPIRVAPATAISAKGGTQPCE